MNEQQLVQEVFVEFLKYGELYGQLPNIEQSLTLDTFRARYRTALNVALAMDDETLKQQFSEQLVYPAFPEEPSETSINYFEIIRSQMGTPEDPVLAYIANMAGPLFESVPWLDKMQTKYGTPANYLFRVGLVLQVPNPRDDMLLPYGMLVSRAFSKLAPRVVKTETASERLQRLVQPTSSTTAMNSDCGVATETYVPSSIEF